MKKRILALGVMLMLGLTACGNTKDVLGIVNEGRVSISGDVTNCKSIRVNLPTSCCDEYAMATNCIMKMENVSSYEVYQIDMLDRKNNEIDPDGTITVEITLSNEMLNAGGDEYKVYRLTAHGCTEINGAEFNDGVIRFETDGTGDFNVVKFDSTGQSTPIYSVPEDEGACGCCG